MDNRERFHRLMRFQPVDRLPIGAGGIWADTMARWVREGYPAGTPPDDYFGTSGLKTAYAGPQSGPWPLSESRVIRETDTEVVRTDGYGRTVRDFKQSTTMPEWLDFPVKTGADLERVLAEQFDLARLDARWPADWEAKVKTWNSPARGDTILFLDGGCYYWTLRSLAGVEHASYLVHDAPELVEELFERINRVCLAGLERTLARLEIDYLGFGEDIAFKTSTLISVSMFRRLLVPRYRKVVDYARAHGVEVIWYDSDGNLWPFMDEYLAVGIDGFAPMEVAAGMDPVALRAKYGRRVRMFGGVDKREIAKGPAAIDALLAHLAPVIREGGYLPGIDHSVSADISLANYTYFLKELRALPLA